MYFAVVRRPGPAWDAGRPMREQDGWPQHAGFMDALAEEGFIVLGGPVGDGSRFMFLVEAASEEEVRARLADDPWSPIERLLLASIDRWRLLLGDPASR
jgi:hypothetical protein